MDENGFETWCRLCAEEQEATILIFSAEAKAMLLQNKLKKYLLIEIDEDDKLPKNICIRCCSKLQMVCDFMDAARGAQDILSQKITEFEQNEQTLNKITIENETWSENETKDCTIEVNVDPMDVLQNSEINMSLPDHEEVCSTHGADDVTYLHAINGDDVTLKLIKKGDVDPTQDSDDKDEVDQSFACSTCNKRFSSELDMKNHSCIQSNEDSHELKFTCNSCGEEYDSKELLLTHLKKHKMNGLCLLCGRVFRTERNLALHMEYHKTSKKLYTCKICGRSYNTKAALKTHSISHSSERPHKCAVCNKDFKRSQDLKIHINLHTGERPYKCPFCDKSFASSGNCYSHRTRMHPGWLSEPKKRRRLETPENKASVIKIIVPNSNSDDPNMKSLMKYQCTLCSHTFMKRENYMYHMYQHTGKKQFQCTFCPEEFVTRKGLFFHHEKAHPSRDRPLGLVSKNALLK